MAERVIVLGVGNPGRGDDGAGRKAAQLLRGTLPDRIDIIEVEGEATSVLAALEGTAVAYVIDACASGAQPGTVRRFDANEAPLPQVSSDVSTHGFGLAAAIELGRNLGRLPPRLIVYAIEGTSFDVGMGLCAEVAVAVARVADSIRAEIDNIPA